jgi:hypothetical protein
VEILALLKRQMEMNRELRSALLRAVGAPRTLLPAPRRASCLDAPPVAGLRNQYEPIKQVVKARTGTCIPMPMPGPVDLSQNVRRRQVNPSGSVRRRPFQALLLAVAAGITFTIAVGLVPAGLLGAMVAAVIGAALVALAAFIAG